MATSTRHLCRSIRQISRKVPAKREAPSTLCSGLQHCPIRPFSTATTRWADDPAFSGRAPAHFSGSQRSSSRSDQPSTSLDEMHESELLTPAEPYTATDLSPEERADYEVLSKPDQAQYLKLQNHFKALFESDEGKAELKSLVDQADYDIEREGGDAVSLEFPTQRVPSNEAGYWAEEEEDEFGQMEDDDDEVSEEHITSVAESELDLHRDIREYTRRAAWDLPLLKKYARPFQPPNHSTPLRFRYTTHMGESHPSQSKVVVEFSTKDLLSHPSSVYKISEPQRIKLIKLVGVRYNPTTDVVKISSEKFDTAAQNKRYLGDLIGSLIKESKDKRDTLADIPFDFRHHKKVVKPVFPEEWKMTSKTVKRLAEARKSKTPQLSSPEVEVEEEVIDGNRLVESYVRVGQLKQAQLLRA